MLSARRSAQIFSRFLLVFQNKVTESMSTDPSSALPESTTAQDMPVAPAAETAAPAPLGQGPLAQRINVPAAQNRRHFTSRSGGGPGPAGGPPRQDRGPKKPRPDRPRREEGEAADGEAKPATDDSQAPSTRELARPAPPPRPSRRDKLTADLEDEFTAAFGGESMDALLSGVDPNALRETLELETRRRSTVVRVHGDNVFFALGGRDEGVVSVRQFAEPPQPGATFDVIVKSFNMEDGLYELYVPGASIEVADWSDLNEGSVVDAKITAANTGGLECEVNKIRGFIPASQVALYRIEDFSDYIGQRLLCVVTEANQQRRNLVLSHRALLEREKEAKRKEFYANLEVGQVYDGTVRKIHDFGAFVDLGGGDGLIHISQLSWEKIKHPSEVVQEGQKVSVRIERVDPDTGKISLSYRNLQDNPWTSAGERFAVGGVYPGVVSRIANFGAFVKLAPGVEGLVHVSELAHYRVTNVSKVVQEGQEVQVKVLTFDAEEQRISLSIKQAIAKPESEKTDEASAEEPETPLRPMAVPKRQGPLKGGLNRPSGGEGFGLKW